MPVNGLEALRSVATRCTGVNICISRLREDVPVIQTWHEVAVYSLAETVYKFSFLIVYPYWEERPIPTPNRPFDPLVAHLTEGF